MYAWNRAANDGLRPKTYPPQRYLERADLTRFLVFNASIFNHNISIRLFGQHYYTCYSRARPGDLKCPGEPKCSVQAGRGATPFRCHLVLDGWEGYEVAWNSITRPTEAVKIR
jgi:hypothetical protein